MSGSEHGEAARAEASLAMARLDRLAAFTDEPGRITRLAFSPALKAANAELLGWDAEKYRQALNRNERAIS